MKKNSHSAGEVAIQFREFLGFFSFLKQRKTGRRKFDRTSLVEVQEVPECFPGPTNKSPDKNLFETYFLYSRTAANTSSSSESFI